MRTKWTRTLRGGVVLLALTTCCLAQAAPVAYTSRSDFDTAVATLANVSTTALNFDSLTAGDLIASGSSLGGITFTYNLGGVSLLVTSGAPTTSAPNFLGTNDAGVLQDGDDIGLGFGARNAIGLYVMSLDPLLDDDFRLTVGTVSASLSTADLQDTLSDGTSTYFLGIVDAASTFTSASVSTSQNGTGFFLWNADDIVSATAGPVPEPGSLVLLAAGLMGLIPAARRRVAMRA